MASKIDLFEKLKKDGVVYMKDDFLECAFRKVYKGGTFLKYKGCTESKVEFSNDTVFQIELGGEFISEGQYAGY